MIEQLPEVQRLTPTEKLQLASELWEELSCESAAVEPDPGIVKLLEKRYSDYQAGLYSSSSWKEVKQRIGKS